MIKSTRPAPSKSLHGAPGGVVIVGAGLAGLFTALKLAPMPVTVVSVTPFGQGGSSVWAQAGIAAALAEGDSPEAHAADTIRAGAGIVDEKIALLLAREARDRVEDLLRYGVPFDRDLEGHLDLGREAAHGARRIVHVKGDTAGRAIMAALTAAAHATPSIRVLRRSGLRAISSCAMDASPGLSSRALAPVAFTPSLVLALRAVVLATGGIGQLYAVTTNPRRIARRRHRHGRPRRRDRSPMRSSCSSIRPRSTSVATRRRSPPRRCAAKAHVLINGRGEAFHVGRSIRWRSSRPATSSRAASIARSMRRPRRLPRLPHASARTSRNSSRRSSPLAARPASTRCSEPIPVAPAEHYHMGGVLTDADGRATLDGLWACGEAASTGAHGANRLASNSLLEAVAFAARVAEDIGTHFPQARLATAAALPEQRRRPRSAPRRHRAPPPHDDRHVGVVRDRAGLEKALGVIARIEAAARAPRRQTCLPPPA